MKRKLVVSFGLICLLALLQSGIFIYVIHHISDIENDISSAKDTVSKAIDIQMQHYKWLQGLSLSVYSDQEFSGSLDHTACSLGKWLSDEEFRSQAHPDITALMDEMYEPHQTIHQTAGQIIKAHENGDFSSDQEIFNTTITPNMDKTISLLDQVIDVTNTHAEATSDSGEQRRAQVYSISYNIIAATATAIIVLSILLITRLLRDIVPPLKRLTSSALEISQGRVDIKIDTGDYKDEFADLALAFNGILQATKLQSKLVTMVAEGDLTVNIEPRSDGDVLNTELAIMVRKNNEAMSRIRSMVSEINLGSGTVSSSAELLANGATEQSAATEELSASIRTISGMAEDTNADTRTLIELTGSMRKAALESNERMEQMVTAVRSIQDASVNIENIVKVIESIAFQTNILALNASVEAARAGVHGKGFAVVAEEVRELAAKSADAAHETTALIEASTNSAQQGADIAEQAEQSLQQIIHKINQSNEIIDRIGQGNGELTSSSRQLLQGIEQVSDVVHKNSASSEELAASSQTLSSLAHSLEEISQLYKLD